MSPDSQGRRPVPELDAEQEVDFGRYWRALVMRWWLPLFGIAAGAIIGALATLGGSSSYKATAQVYLGQPFGPGGAVSVVSAPTTLGLVSNLVQSDSTVRAVAARVDLKPGRLKGHITTKAITGITGAKLGTPAPLLAITVTGSPPLKIAEAANDLAGVVVRQVSPYTQAKIQVLEDNLARDNAFLTSLAESLATARQNQQQILGDKSISQTDKLIALANLNSVITQAQQQQNATEQDRFQVRQQLSLAQNIEAPRLVSRAAATKTAPPSRKTAIVVGAFIGLLIGLLAALVWEPLTVRLRPQR